MPLTSKGNKILGNMTSEYGAKKGKSVFYASINAGKIKGAEPSTPKTRPMDMHEARKRHK